MLALLSKSAGRLPPHFPTQFGSVKGQRAVMKAVTVFVIFSIAVAFSLDAAEFEAEREDSDSVQDNAPDNNPPTGGTCSCRCPDVCEGSGLPGAGSAATVHAADYGSHLDLPGEYHAFYLFSCHFILSNYFKCKTCSYCNNSKYFRAKINDNFSTM